MLILFPVPSARHDVLQTAQNIDTGQRTASSTFTVDMHSFAPNIILANGSLRNYGLYLLYPVSTPSPPSPPTLLSLL